MTNPFALIRAQGEGITRGVTLALPTETVRNLLPAGLEPGPQHISPEGTHPVILFFHDFFRAGFSIPTLLPSQSYREFSLNVPFTYISRESITPGYPGPYHFLPRLFLDNLSATVTGLLGWGLAKEMAAFRLTTDRYSISELSGARITSLSWKAEAGGRHRPIADWPNFAPVRDMLRQPMILRYPLGLGPFFVAANFDRNWDTAVLQPIQTVLDVDYEYVPGYPAGRYPGSGWSPGIDESVLGSYELVAPWWLSMPYPPLFSFR
jgi:Acetoacetate decarboxylase (ADC)